MDIVPVTLAEAKRFVSQHHRHNRPPKGWQFGNGLMVDGELVGVAVAGRPGARLLDKYGNIEITRVCTTGCRNANSKLYGAILRAAKALGYRRAYTYTLESESGSTMTAVGFKEDAKLPPRQVYNTPGSKRQRLQVDLFGNEMRPPEAKIRWVKILCKKAEKVQGDLSG